MTIFQDDGHFGDITGSAAEFTFTYDDAKVLTIDTTIVLDNTYSGIVIGDQVVLARFGSAGAATNNMWEMSTAAVLTESFEPFNSGLVGTHQSGSSMDNYGVITAINGSFAVMGPVGGGDASADETAWIITTFPLDDI